MKTYALGLVTVVGVVAAFLGSNGVFHLATKEEVRNVLIQDKERIVDNSGAITSKYLIYTDREVFENVDTLWELKWDSSDLYGKIQKGQVCNFTVTGFHIPFLGSYRNILTADCETVNS